jgi:hypothetical protein
MVLPGADEFILVSPDRILDLLQLGATQAIIFGQFEFGFKPEFRFTVRMHDMDVHSPFLSREKVIPVPGFAIDGRAHSRLFPWKGCYTT